MARFCADAQHFHGPLALKYYKQRASIRWPSPKGLSDHCWVGGYRNPWYWSDEQIEGWLPTRYIKRVVHLPPAPSVRAHHIFGCSSRRRRVLARRAEPNLTPIPKPDDNASLPPPLPRVLTVEEIGEENVASVTVGYSDFVYINVLRPTTHHRPNGKGDTGNKDSNKLLRDTWVDGTYIANSDIGRDYARGR
ncbi:hypothetical protein DFH94DRAFT_678169 [Russula ochroleuca]|uniref:Uncharacterized protein n=1 Tax=Russula ochroleuca TaxID=152965 RepID=A0A9P5TEF3_9AGAM|nr:hypothetical protein DFH94DRAFT_678169 [Russula ochroleuca]